jgi:hypothetical protein
MTAFQLQAFVPADGTLSITLPEHFRESNVKVKMYVSKEETEEVRKGSDEYITGIDPSSGKFIKRPRRSPEEYIARMNSFVGTLHNVDYSDIREETDREI